MQELCFVSEDFAVGDYAGKAEEGDNDRFSVEDWGFAERLWREGVGGAVGRSLVWE
jgi:hypothetical protein